METTLEDARLPTSRDEVGTPGTTANEDGAAASRVWLGIRALARVAYTSKAGMFVRHTMGGPATTVWEWLQPRVAAASGTFSGPLASPIEFGQLAAFVRHDNFLLLAMP